MAALAAGGAPGDPDSALVLANVLNSLVTDGDKNSMGMEVQQQAVEVGESLVGALEEMEVSSPQELLPVMESIMETVGSVLGGMLGGGRSEEEGAENDNTTDTSDPCSGVSSSALELFQYFLVYQVSVIDKINADKPGVVEYETDVGDSLEMEVPLDLAAQRCEGILSATEAAGANTGAKVTNMVDQMTAMLLAKSVVGSEHKIDTENIKIYAAMKSGEEAKNTFSILDTGVQVLFYTSNHICTIVNRLSCRTVSAWSRSRPGSAWPRWGSPPWST